MSMNKFLLLLTVCALTGVSAWAQDAGSSSAAAPEVTASDVDAASKSAGEKTAPANKEGVESGTQQETKIDPELEKDLQKATIPASEEKEAFVTPREDVKTEVVKKEKKPKVEYRPKNRRDPTLSPDDVLLLQFREQQRLAALEAERQRKLAEERRKREEEERLRQLELARIKDPTREVRNKIRIDGIVGQEVFIGDKVYTVGNKIFGARITEVNPDEVVFSYKGHKFVRKMK